MTDVEMADANATANNAEDKGKAVAKAPKPTGGEGAVDSKKKFEVKKVCCHSRNEMQKIDQISGML
jgi:hypothetical protein